MVVRRHSARRHFQVLRPVHLLHCVPSQPLHFRWRIGGVDADGERNRNQSLNLSLRKTLLKMSPQIFSLCGICSRLISPRATAVLVSNVYYACLRRSLDVLLEDFLPMFSLSITSSFQTTAGLDLGPPLRRRTPCGVLSWS